ncbi:hypothetical protein AB6A40_007490 [Gnathostoma spinigerum]|uniref:Basement membrane-specific heparan sulfate proteoglycan core protein n=1 Tax=Gnathostoma spinigerum TaxID=75299 RepID=A0ABD6ELX0_9BILA
MSSKWPVKVNEKHLIDLSLKNGVVDFMVNGHRTPGRDKLDPFVPYTDFFIGGVAPGIIPNRRFGVTSSFDGCLTKLEVDGEKIGLVEAATLSSGGITECRPPRVIPTSSTVFTTTLGTTTQPVPSIHTTTILPTTTTTTITSSLSTVGEDFRTTVEPKLTSASTETLMRESEEHTLPQEEQEEATMPTLIVDETSPIILSDDKITGKCVGIECEQNATLCGPKTCGDHGDCEVFNETHFTCSCRDYYDGPMCEQFKPIEYAAQFDGKAFIVFSADEFPHLTSEREETIELRFKTDADFGVLFWQGQQPETALLGEDYVSIGLNDGYLVFSYELGGGAAQITSTEPVNDGKEHHLKAARKGRNGTLTIDNNTPIEGHSSGILAMLNVEGDIYLGGLPDLDGMTAGLHEENFVGCIADVKLNSVRLDLMANAIDGRNVKPCEQWIVKKKWLRSKYFRR